MPNGDCFDDVDELADIALKKAVEEKNVTDIYIIQTLKRITNILPNHSQRITSLETFKVRVMVLWGILIAGVTYLADRIWTDS